MTEDLQRKLQERDGVVLRDGHRGMYIPTNLIDDRILSVFRLYITVSAFFVS